LVGLVVGADQLGHQRCDGIGVDRLAPAGCEDVPVLVSAPGVARFQLLRRLVLRWRRTATVSSLMETTQARPLLVVSLTRSAAITAVDPEMVIFFPTRSTSSQQRFKQLAARSGVRRDVKEGEQPVLPRGVAVDVLAVPGLDSALVTGGLGFFLAGEAADPFRLADTRCVQDLRPR
jgi:hypothetical protein